MAIARGAGTEIIRSISLEHVTDTSARLIYGVQHHIYTVLSVSIFNETIGATGAYNSMYLQAYDAYGSDTASTIWIFQQPTGLVKETFVWNDKFSFNGCEGTDFSGAMNSEADQNLISDQAESGIPQLLWILSSNNNNKIDVHCTYIDQNNA